MRSNKSKNLLINLIYSLYIAIYPPQTLSSCEFLSFALHQIACVRQKCFSWNEMNFMFWADGRRLFVLHSQALRAGRAVIVIGSRLSGCPPTRQPGEDLIGWQGTAGSQCQDGTVPLRYHIPAWLMQHSWNHRQVPSVKKRRRKLCDVS